jgi:hypothetical protein
MSTEQIADGMWIIGDDPQQPGESWKIYVPLSATIEVKDSAGKLLASLSPSVARRVTAGSQELKLRASSGPPGDTEKSRKDTPQDEPAGSTWRDLFSWPSTRAREQVRYARLILALLRTLPGLTLSEACSIADQVENVRPKSASPP